MTAMPSIILVVMYWLHMLATVAWIGALVALSTLILPVARKSLSAEGYASLLGQIGPRLQRTGWLSLAILVVTGMFQMSSSPGYLGFLTIENPWSLAMLLKHIAVGIMAILGAIQTWGINPALQRLAIRRSAGIPVGSQENQQVQYQETLLLKINLYASLLVLLFTAWARAS
jgi:uncharacterized membrane protein